VVRRAADAGAVRVRGGFACWMVAFLEFGWRGLMETRLGRIGVVG
jgi:hypothetical protein